MNPANWRVKNRHGSVEEEREVLHVAVVFIQTAAVLTVSRLQVRYPGTGVFVCFLRVLPEFPAS